MYADPTDKGTPSFSAGIPAGPLRSPPLKKPILSLIITYYSLKVNNKTLMGGNNPLGIKFGLYGVEIVHEKYRERYRLLGLRIAYYRKRKGYTQEQFAELIGKSWSFISQVEANNGATLKGISLDTLFSMSDALGVPPSKFLEED